MSTRPMIVGPGTVVTNYEAGAAVVEDGAVAVEGDRIRAVGTFEAVTREWPTADLLNARGGLIMPGLVNLHHHFYSAPARGLDPGAELPDFGRILEGLWWRLDRALDTDTVRLSAALSAADCIRWGCTTVFDHHASPSCLEGSLDVIASVVREAGLAAALCYEVSDRNGRDEARAGLEENLRFAADHRADPTVRGLLGLHASFTVSDESLAEAARLRPADLGIHIHLCEDLIDEEMSRERYGASPLERLDRAGLLDQRALLVHGVHLSAEEYSRIADSGAVLVHNPESNANNAVGRLDLPFAQGLGCVVGLGTDGMSSNMLRSLRAAFLGLRAGSRDATAGWDSTSRLLAANARRAADLFEESLLGRLETGAPADVIVLDGPPPTPVESSNVFGHLVFGAAEAAVRHTVARGKVLLKDFRHTTVDAAALAVEARAATPGLWARFREV